jgi:prophage antirepressor-like protein
MNSITFFEFDCKEIRVILINNEPWFVAKDLCDVLEINNSRQALSRLDDDDKGVTNTDTLGGKQELAIVSEFFFIKYGKIKKQQ